MVSLLKLHMVTFLTTMRHQAARWIPADIAASVALKLTFTEHEARGSIEHYHLENPTTTPWSEIANAISQHNGGNLPPVPLKQWGSKLREHGIEGAGRVSAIPLVDFYENLDAFPALDVSKTLKIAPEVNCGLVSSELMTRYLKYQGI